jgi:tRNA(fMet)-specific endonuclease VapC
VPFTHLLDTNILSDLIRHPQGEVSSRITALGEGVVCTSIIVAAELRYGASKSGSKPLGERVDLLLSAMEVLALEAPADRVYGAIRAQLTRQGTIIGPNDLLIAAQTLAMNLTLVTANTKEFMRVPGLRVENWFDT